MNDDLLGERLVRRLDILIALLLDSSPGTEHVQTATKIQRLTALGVSPAETASILGKPTNYVTASLAGKKRTTRRPRRNG